MIESIPGLAASFACAFAVCGTICVLAQLLMMLPKVTPPVLLNLLLVLGGLLTPCGLMAWLGEAAGGGFLVAICAAGNAFATAGALAASGSPEMLVAILALFAVTTLCGMLAGEFRHRRER